MAYSKADVQRHERSFCHGLDDIAPLAAGTFQLLSSAHCPFRYDDHAGKTGERARASFRAVPNGIPGLAARLPILFSEGGGKSRNTLQDFVALTSTNHARLYNLYPRKGSIAVIAYVDIAIWDPARRVTIAQELMHFGIAYIFYERLEVTSWAPAAGLSCRR